MLRKLKLPPNDRVLIVSPVNRYKISGPGRVWLTLRQKVATRLYVGPWGHSLVYEQVRTAENIPLKIKVQLLAQVDPTLFKDDLLPKLPALNSGGWDGVIRWQTEYVLRQMVAQQSWQRLNQENVQKRVERQLKEALADRLAFVGLRAVNAAFVSIELPQDLQQAIVEAEREFIEATGRAKLLEVYRKIFGENLSQVMPLVVQWELLNSIHQNQANIWLNASPLGNGKAALTLTAGDESPASRYQMGLPLQ
jgi:hypothetical protein